MVPSPIVELRIEEDRVPIEVSDEGGIDLAAVDRLQNRDHRLRRLEAADIDMDGVGRSPYPGFRLRPSATHIDTPSMPSVDKSVPQYLIMRYGFMSHGSGPNMQEATKVNSAVRVRRVRAADIPYVIALDTRVTRLAKTEYWNEIFRRYGKQRSDERFFLVAESRQDRSASPVLGFIIGEVRAWEFGSAPCGWVFALSVEPRMRLHGVGSALLEAISAEFRKAGVDKMRTMAARDGRLPLLFFRSEGMIAGPYIQLEKDLD